MDQQKSSLCVSLHNIEFQKPYHYFVTVQLGMDGEKRRTDVSANVANPVFTASVFVLPLNNFKIEINDILNFQAFVVTGREDNQEIGISSQGQVFLIGILIIQQARLLGECTLALGPLTGSLTDISGLGVRQHLKFIRLQGEKQVTVGRLIVNLKLVVLYFEKHIYKGEQVIPIDNVDQMPLEQDEIFHALPAADPFMNFSWRLRIDVRSGVDFPLNRNTTSQLPSPYVELGWTAVENQPAEDKSIYFTKIVEHNRHPIWNQQFIIPNPISVTNKDGYLYLCLKDRDFQQGAPIEEIYLPLQPMRPFVPMNLEILCRNAEYEARPKLFLSVTLEMKNKESFEDDLCDIIVKMVNFDPLPYSSRMFLLMSQNFTKLDVIPFVTMDLRGPGTIAQIIQDACSNPKPIFISTVMKIPPHKLESVYNAVAVFTLPKTYLDRGICFHIGTRDDSIPSNHAMPNSIVGYSDIVDDTLKRLYYSRDNKQALVPVTWSQQCKVYPQFSQSRCTIELACLDTEEQPGLIKPPSRQNISRSGGLPPPRTPELKGPQNLTQTDKQRWELLSRELSQKQEMVHRLMKDVDDKTESLKITGTEIVDLRRQIKLLQSENMILRKRMAHDESLEIQAVVTKEIAMMSVEELRQKIIKVAQAYRNERVRNEEFEKALKAAQKDIANSRQLQVELEQLQRIHQENAKKMLAMQQEIQKVTLYKETIKKQEKVIGKLEKLMETSLKDAQKSRQAQLELEQLKTENMQLQKQLKGIVYGEELGELEKYKNECMRLEKIVANMKEELRNKRPASSGGDDESEKIELEIKLHKANARIDALQDEMTYNARNYAKEIAQLKLIVAEKQALLDSLTLGDY